MPSASEFYARPDEKIRPKLLALARFVVSQGRLQSGGGMRRHQYTNGTTVIADSSSSAFVGSFNVRVANMAASVGEGQIDGITPTINLIAIDGIDAEGNIVPVPTLPLDSGPNDALRSWICAEAIIDPETGMINQDAQEPLRITHRQSVTGGSDPASSVTGILPLAMIIWQDAKTISRARQIIYFDQQIQFTRASETRPAQIKFTAAS